MQIYYSQCEWKLCYLDNSVRLRADNDNKVQCVHAREYLLAVLKRAARMSCPVEKQIGSSVCLRAACGGWKSLKVELKAKRHGT